MKLRKMFMVLGAALMAAAGIMAALSACVSTSTNVYYGCPNSKRIEKLNLVKKKIGK